MLSIYPNNFIFDMVLKFIHLFFQSSHKLVNQTLKVGPVCSLEHALLKILVKKKKLF